MRPGVPAIRETSPTNTSFKGSVYARRYSSFVCRIYSHVRLRTLVQDALDQSHYSAGHLLQLSSVLYRTPEVRGLGRTCGTLPETVLQTGGNSQESRARRQNGQGPGGRAGQEE